MTGDTDQILFSESGNISEDLQMIWHQSGDTLTIQFCRTQGFLGIHSNISKDLVVTVPRDYAFRELDIESVSARISASGLIAEEVDLENVSGTCVFENCGAQKMTADTVSGSVTFSGSLAALQCSTVSGDCTLKAVNTPEELSLDGVSGDLILELPESCGFTAEIDSLSGTISSDFETVLSKDRRIYGDGSCRISADTTSGNMIIRKAS